MIKWELVSGELIRPTWKSIIDTQMDVLLSLEVIKTDHWLPLTRGIIFATEESYLYYLENSGDNND